MEKELTIKKSNLEELKGKIEFVSKVSDAIGNNKYLSVKKVELDVFFDTNGCLWEYLVVTYKGDAIATRNCNWNSCSANFGEINNLLNGGYYDEVYEYERLKRGSTNIFNKKVKIIEENA